MGVDMEEISQTERYEAGHYRDAVLTAVRQRDAIEAVLASHRTKAVELESADDDEASGSGDLSRFPYKPYCRDCGRDTVTLTAYDDETTALSYTCDFNGYTGVTVLASEFEGKLVWKVDWPMRWAFEHVDFEPAGMDHATPGSSFTVGHSLVEDIFGMPRPAWFGYGFVGFAGVQKMSSSAGGAPTAEDALKVLEAPILRWLYVRRNPKQTFNIDFGTEIVRLYDEWDSLGRKALDPARRDAQVLAYERAVSTAAAGRLPAPAKVESFRLLSSVADVTNGDSAQISRIVGASVEDLEPRLSRAVELDPGLRAGLRPNHRAHLPRPRAALLAVRGRAALAGPSCWTGCPPSWISTARRRWSTAYPSWPAAWPSTTSRPTRSRPTRRRSSGCSTSSWSAPSAAPGSPRSSSRSAADTVRSLLTPPPA